MDFERWFYTVPLRLRSLFRRRRVERELEEELQYHLERQIEEYAARGLTPEDARLAALRALGGVERRKEECREMRRVGLIESTLQDFRYAVRGLRRSLGVTAVGVLSLALGIGANSAIFQLLNAVRLRSLPVVDPQQLAEVRIAGESRGYGGIDGRQSELTYALWERIRQSQEGFSGIFAWGAQDFSLDEGRDWRQVRGFWVSGELFSVLGVTPVRGRLFTPADDHRGCEGGGVVISYEFWQNYFGSKDSAIGRTLKVRGQLQPVIGVTPPEFFGLEVGEGFDLALPLCARGINQLNRLDYFWLVVMGRLRPDWSLAQAAAQVNSISPALFEATLPPGYDNVNNTKYRNFRLTALPAEQGVSRLRRNYESSLWLLLAITGLVLLIACANLANLMLARASAREREIAVRVALGASRARLIRLLLSESLLLAALGTILGAGLARLTSQGLVSFLSTGNNLLRLDLDTDWRVLAFTAAVAVLTSVIFGLIPALRASRIEPGVAMKSGGRGLTAGRERFSYQRFLVVGQIAFLLTLLFGALLFVRSFWNLTTLDAGFRQKGVLFVGPDFRNLHLEADQFLVYEKNLLEQVRTIPGVESASLSNHIPLSGTGILLKVRGPGAGDGAATSTKFNYVSPRYFEAMKIPLLAGRDVNDFDTATSGPVAIVNEAFVRRFIPGRDPIGATVRSLKEPRYPETDYQVIGIVKDSKYTDLRREVPAVVYVPLTQNPNPFGRPNLVIRSSIPLADVMAEVRRRVDAWNPEVRLEFRIFEQQIREDLTRERLMAWLAGIFGALAAILAIIGLYGMISYRVLQRQNEIGIRLALGATRPRIVILILREVLVLLAVGLGIGALISLAAAQGAGSLLYGLSPSDLPTLAASVCLLAAVAGVASLVPALRASRVDPMVALRHD
ncbi:MAG TPA: ABC transporter permease [Blastocatellia bacterium]|nr:ABC transporter permease [Blastocatellia bacterium]